MLVRCALSGIHRAFSTPRATSVSILSFAAFLVLLGLASSARADIIGVTISGPGGIGALGPTGGTLTEPALNYSSNLPLDVSISIDAAGEYYVSETTSFAGIAGVENNTGVTWSGFEWELISSPPGALVYDSLNF